MYRCAAIAPISVRELVVLDVADAYALREAGESFQPRTY